MMTNGSGIYSFTGLTPGVGYYVVFGTLTGYTRSPQYAQGPDPAFTNNNDSNANAATGQTDCVTLTPGQTNNTIDAGLVPSPASWGDRVWSAIAVNVVQNTGEPGLGGVSV